MHVSSQESRLQRIRSTEQRVIVDDANIRKDSSLSVRIAELQSGICADCRHMCYTICLKFGGTSEPKVAGDCGPFAGPYDSPA